MMGRCTADACSAPLNHMNGQGIIGILQKLISFKTVKGNTKEIRKAFSYIASLFIGLPIQKKVFKKNNSESHLFFFRGNSRKNPEVLLSGHIDVVPSKEKKSFIPRRNGTKIYGRGSSDMKGPLAAFITVMQKMAMLSPSPQVVLLVTSDEETGGSDGVGHVVKKVRPRFVIDGDSGKQDPLVILTKTRGAAWVELAFRGKSAHGARPWLGDNAVEKAMRGIQKIKKFVGRGSPGVWKNSINLSWIETSNRTPNIVPDNARAVLDIRYTQALAKDGNSLLLKIKSLLPGVGVRILNESSLYVTNERSDYVKRLKAAVKKVSGKHPSLSFDEGSNDGRYFAKLGIPVVVIGAGGGDRHGDQEWVDSKNIELLGKILMEFLYGFTT